MQVITEYDDSEIDTVLEITERLEAHLTAAVVSNDVLFLGKVRGLTLQNQLFPGTHSFPLKRLHSRVRIWRARSWTDKWSHLSSPFPGFQ